MEPKVSTEGSLEYTSHRLVVNGVAEPELLMKLLPVRTIFPVAARALFSVTPAEPIRVMLPEVVSVPVVANIPPLLSKSIEPVPVLKFVVAGSVNVVPATAAMPVFAPRVGTASVRAFLSVIDTLAPEPMSVTAA